MSQTKSVIVNGVHYDEHTGLPLQAAKKPVVQNVSHRVSPQAIHAKGLHQTRQRSATLSREFVKKAPSAARPVHKIEVKRPIAERSPHITRFAGDVRPAHKVAKTSHDVAPTVHPHVAKTHHAMAPAHHHAPKTAHEIKNSAISKALANAKPHQGVQHVTKPRGRKATIVAAALSLLLLGGYYTYINMPSLSVRVAAAQAGIDASYPEYRPIGYRLNGPVAYKDGEVSMEFASNSGPQRFALAQTKSSWDSSALLENFVSPKSDDHYATYTDAGLTIYTFGNDAAWVNGGILYSIEGNARLSNEQVRRIATSM